MFSNQDYCSNNSILNPGDEMVDRTSSDLHSKYFSVNCLNILKPSFNFIQTKKNTPRLIWDPVNYLWWSFSAKIVEIETVNGFFENFLQNHDLDTYCPKRTNHISVIHCTKKEVFH